MRREERVGSQAGGGPVAVCGWEEGLCEEGSGQACGGRMVDSGQDTLRSWWDDLGLGEEYQD